MNRLLKALLGLVAALAIAAGALSFAVQRFLHQEMTLPDAATTFAVTPGSSFANISRDLSDQGYIQHPDWFRWYARLTNQAGAVQAGEYQLAAGTTPAQLLKMMVEGKVLLYSFTIVEGWTFRELLAALDASETIALDMTWEDWPAVLEAINPEATHPEGQFLPETYRFPKGTTGTDILRQAHALLQETLAEEWEGRAVGLPLKSPYEALILASIVEKETALATERPLIAGVFTRRLEQRMRLQTDPTVIYGLGSEFDGNLTRRHLRSDTPYNTYTRHGLPPTPIAMPGRAAIHAALHPEPGTAIYFVATGLGDGSHKFSDSKEEHDRAVREYLQRQRARRSEDDRQ